MTEQQLEAAARELCRLRGFDPDQPDMCNARTERVAVAAPAGPVHGLMRFETRYEPLWKRMAWEVVAWDQMRQAVRGAESTAGAPATPEGTP